MVMKEHTEHQKALHRAVYNDWGLYQFVQMLEYKCVLARRRRWSTSMSAIAPSGVVGAGTNSPCHFTNGPIAARIVGWSWTVTRIVRSPITSGSLPGLGHTRANPCGVRLFSPQLSTCHHVEEGRSRYGQGNLLPRIVSACPTPQRRVETAPLWALGV